MLYGTTALHTACSYGADLCAKLLLESGARVNLCSEDGLSPLHASCRRGHVGCLEILLDAAADPNLVDNKGHSPMVLAVMFGHAACVEALLEAGVEDGRDASQPSALEIARRLEADEAVRLLEGASSVRGD